jgi:hypothetical protein
MRSAKKKNIESISFSDFYFLWQWYIREHKKSCYRKPGLSCVEGWDYSTSLVHKDREFGRALIKVCEMVKSSDLFPRFGEEIHLIN